ncbi:MAG: hypothetical protein IJQ65_04505, partial [Kiritimatiellae bacterium]|nr:hypothetical protein [Kiritimatiellia bacterium]
LSVARANSPSVALAVPIGDSYVYSDAPEGTTAFYDDMTGVGDNACDLWQEAWKNLGDEKMAATYPENLGKGAPYPQTRQSP